MSELLDNGKAGQMDAQPLIIRLQKAELSMPTVKDGLCAAGLADPRSLCDPSVFFGPEGPEVGKRVEHEFPGVSGPRVKESSEWT